LNKVAPGLCYVIEQALWCDLVMHISRMNDRPDMGKYKHLSVKCLQDLLCATAESKTRDLFADVDQQCQFAHDSRNKLIAHRDYETALRKGAEPIPAGTLDEMQKAIDAITKLLNVLELHYCQRTVVYDAFGVLGGADRLLHVLKLGWEEIEKNLVRPTQDG